MFARVCFFTFLIVLSTESNAKLFAHPTFSTSLNGVVFRLVEPGKLSLRRQKRFKFEKAGRRLVAQLSDAGALEVYDWKSKLDLDQVLDLSERDVLRNTLLDVSTVKGSPIAQLIGKRNSAALRRWISRPAPKTEGGFSWARHITFAAHPEYGLPKEPFQLSVHVGGWIQVTRGGRLLQETDQFGETTVHESTGNRYFDSKISYSLKSLWPMVVGKSERRLSADPEVVLGKLYEQVKNSIRTLPLNKNQKWRFEYDGLTYWLKLEYWEFVGGKLFLSTDEGVRLIEITPHRTRFNSNAIHFSELANLASHLYPEISIRGQVLVAEEEAAWKRHVRTRPHEPVVQGGAWEGSAGHVVKDGIIYEVFKNGYVGGERWVRKGKVPR